MLIRMALQGDGSVGNPRRLAMPNYILVSLDVANGRAIVDIPDDDAPDDTDAPGTARFPLVNGRPVLVGLTLAQRLKWRLRLAARWRQMFDPSGVDVT